MKAKFILIPLAFFTMFYCMSCSSESTSMDDDTIIEYDTIRNYKNPVGNITNIGDPYVMKHDEKYYMYATSAGSKGFKVWTSDNLVTWKEGIRLAFDKTSSGNDGWGADRFWAPEVEYINGAFYMIYSAGVASQPSGGLMKLRIASSYNPTGPFINYSEPLFENDNLSYIDGDFFVDDDGTIYLYYSKDCSTNIINGKKTSQTFVVKMKDDLTGVDDSMEPVLCITPGQEWECASGGPFWNEGPYVIKENSKYILTYSANYYADIKYAVGVAYADTPLGPWEKDENNPILEYSREKEVSGTGHSCITTSPDDKEYFIVYHAHTFYSAPGGNRTMYIDRVNVGEEGKLTVDGPTVDEEPLPSGLGEYILVEK